MNKKGIFGVLGIFLVLLIIGLLGVEGQIDLEEGLEDVGGSLEDNLERGEDLVNKFGDPVNTKEFLRQEWTDLLDRIPLGQFFLAIGELFQLFDIFFILIVGAGFTYSWFFFLTLLFWISMVVTYYRIYMPALREAFKSKILLYLSVNFFALLLSILVSLTGVFPFLAQGIINVISFFDSIVLQLVLIIFVFILMAHVFLLSNELRRISIKIGESIRERRLERIEKKTEVASKVTEKLAEGYEKGKS